MTIQPGSKLATYEIVEAIGQGGMGIVYRARDTRLGRDVAIKLLPEELEKDRDRLARFEREAKLLAQLNHPCIATLHGLEESGGTTFLVMELIEGETLGERIAGGPLSLQDTLPVFLQIAEGLETAHEKGIVHRDLKPANIKITPDGGVKILDFGLAKALSVESDVSAGTSQSPTLTKGTALGVIMGTASYMSPEQARGKLVDKRTDIWAFGCCFYEALTGRKAFDGETVSDIISAVLRAEPHFESLPRKVGSLIRSCLTKEPRERLRDIGDARIALARDELDVEPVVPTRRWPLILALGLFAGIAIGVFLSRPASPPDVSVRRLNVRLPVDHVEGVPVLSPDGTAIAFRSAERLYLHNLDEAEAQLVSDTEYAGVLPTSFSPDGQWLGFSANLGMFKASVHGGPPVRLAETAFAAFDWGEDGYLYFTSPGREGIHRIPAAGGETEPVTRPESSTAHVQPEVLPGANAILYVALGGGDNQPSQIEAFSIESRETTIIVRGANTPRYAASGHLIFEQNGTLVAAPFDADRLELSGPQVTLEHDVARVNRYYGYQSAYSVSQAGHLVYRERAARAPREIVWVSRDGTEEPTGIAPGDYSSPSISPDGRRLCLVEGRQLWVHDLTTRTRVRVTSTEFTAGAIWTPDGKRLIFSSLRDGQLYLFWQPADGTGPAELLSESAFTQFATDVSRDGLLFISRFEGRGNTWTLDLDTRAAVPFLDAPDYAEGFGKLSPDGRWFAYVSDESGRREVYIRPFPGPEPRYSVSAEGGESPKWSRDGRELFFWSGDRMMAAGIRAVPELEVSTPRELLRGPYLNYSVAPDGRFIMLKDTSLAEHPSEVVLIDGWFDELKRLVPKN